jgi:Asp-tRNA(Asn)/Glu-tRNA(Gln) amidotransferase A subunit family amidase
MAAMIRRLAKRVRGGGRLRDVVLESLKTIENTDGDEAPVVCRTSEEMAEADSLEWRELSASMLSLGLEKSYIDQIQLIEKRSCESIAGAADEDSGRRRIFDLFAGTPATAVTGIAIAHLNDRLEDITGSAEADTYLRVLRAELRKLPEDVQRALVAAVSSRPVHAFIRRFAVDDVLREADETEQRLKRHGDHLPLIGVTLAVKDLFAFGATTAASRILADYVAPEDYVATAVANLRRFGAILVGKTNLDEFALGSSSESSAFWPAPRNPLDAARVPGGSSGGSAAAVRSGMATAAIGSDTAGSIRLPASYCGCVGVKPTYGLVSRFGLFALASSLDCVGPIAMSVEDAAILLGCLVGEGPDGLDQTQRRSPAQRTSSSCPSEDLYAGELRDQVALAESLRGLTIGVPIEYFLDFDLDERDEAAELEERSRQLGDIDFSELAARRDRRHLTGTVIGAFFDWLHQSAHLRLDDETIEPLWQQFQVTSTFEQDSAAPLDKLRRCASYWDRFPQLLRWLRTEFGVELRLVSLPHTSLSIPAYFIISRYELASNLHRYDGLKYGRAAKESLHGSYHFEAAARRMASLGTQPKQRILMGIHALQQANHETLVMRAQRARYLIREDFTRVFSAGIDLLLAPTVNTVAPYFGGFSDTVAQQQMDQFSVPADHAGIPAISVPFYRTLDESTPLVFPDLARPLYQSVQVIAPEFEEGRMFRLASVIERWHSLYGDTAS